MGLCVSTNNTSFKYKVFNPKDDEYYKISNHLLPMLEYENVYNINRRYTYMIKYLHDQFTENDIKKTHSYSCLLTELELNDKIKEFWETRIEGNILVWNNLKLLLDNNNMNDDEVFKCFYDLGVKFISNTVQICYDTEGNKYDLPVFVINKPLNYLEIKKELNFKNLNEKIKFIYLNNNIELLITGNEIINEIKNKCNEILKIDDNKYFIKLAQLGRIWNNSETIKNIFNDNYPVQIFKINKIC